jgi:hypothetical protein
LNQVFKIPFLDIIYENYLEYVGGRASFNNILFNTQANKDVLIDYTGHI